MNALRGNRSLFRTVWTIASTRVQLQAYPGPVGGGGGSAIRRQAALGKLYMNTVTRVIRSAQKMSVLLTSVEYKVIILYSI